MAFVNPNVVQTIKNAADITSLTTQAAKELLGIFSPQNKNLFEMILSPQELSSKNVAWAALDTIMTTIYVQSIDIPFFNIEYKRYNHEQGAFDLAYPDEISIKIIDNEESFARIYIQKWISDTVNLRYYSGIPGDYVFKNDQNAAKKQAMIIPQMTLGVPSLCWIKINGMRYKSIENLSFSQDDSGPLILNLVCAVDNVKLFSPATPFL